MTGSLQSLFAPPPLKASLFPATSRYHALDVTSIETAEGRTIVYLRRRFVPASDAFTMLLEHTVVEGDRLDNLAATYLGDPEQFWQLCDANGAIRPDELIAVIGRRLRITLPEGVPGATSG